MLPDFDLDLEWRGKRYEDVNRGLVAFGVDVAEDFEKLMPVAKNIIRKYMEGVVKSVHDRVDTPYPGGTSRGGTFPGTLSKRSGKLASSLVPALIKDKGGKDEISTSFTLTGIAVVHERGATIRAKNSQYLTIPLPAALNSRGVPLKPSARAWRNTFVAKSRKGNLLIFQKRGKNDIVPLYVLKKRVRIPKRLAFGEAFAAGKDLLADTLAAGLLKEFNNAR